MSHSTTEPDPHRPERPPHAAGVPLRAVLCVGAGGAVGTLLRVVLIGESPELVPMLRVNVVGSLLLGAVSVLPRIARGSRSVRHRGRTGASEPWQWFLGPGVCGGFTSMSAVSVLLWSLTRQLLLCEAAWCVCATVLAGVVAFWLGGALIG